MRNDSTEFFVGIDLGDIENKVAILHRDGEEPDTGVVENTVASKMGPKRGAVEKVGLGLWRG